MLARLVAELDVPMDEHGCMIEAVDSVSYEWFMKEIESYSRVRQGWERFLLARCVGQNPPLTCGRV